MTIRSSSAGAGCRRGRRSASRWRAPCSADPRYLILDEPNASLDAEGDAQLTKTIEEAKAAGTTILIVAHRMSVLPVVDTLLVIRDGRDRLPRPARRNLAQTRAAAAARCRSSPMNKHSLAIPGQGPIAAAYPRRCHRRRRPARDIRIGLIIGALFFIGLLGWAAVARLDAAAIAPGRLVVSGQRQTVQHRDGGVVADIAVKEGASVRQGQILIRLAGAEVRAQERALAGQTITLLAQRARLQAEAAGPLADRRAARIRCADRRGPARRDARAPGPAGPVADARRGAVGAARSDRPAHLASLEPGQRLQPAGRRGRRAIAADRGRIELALRGVAEKGFVSKTRVRALERQKAELEGQRGQFAATVAQTGSQQGETRLQILETQNNYYERIATELRDVETALADARPKWAAARDQLARIDIRAPATGTVVGLTRVHPRRGHLAGAETDGHRPRPSAADDRGTAVARGRRRRARQPEGVRSLRHAPRIARCRRSTAWSRRVSADSLTDERTGESFYTAEISVPLSELSKIDELRGADTLRAGIPVSIEIPLRKRTALAYAFEPLSGALRRSFNEH